MDNNSLELCLKPTPQCEEFPYNATLLEQDGLLMTGFIKRSTGKVITKDMI